MTARRTLMNGLAIATLISCLAILGCTGKKGHCEPCQNNSECSSGECATFISNSGDKSLRCGNGSPSSRDTCTVS